MDRPTYILLDTNVGVHEARFFQTQDGKRLVAFLLASGVKLLMPAVLADEYVKHFGEVTTANVSKMEGCAGVLESLWGWRRPDDLPRRTSHIDAANRHLEAFQEFAEFVPLTAAHKDGVVARGIAGRTPSGMKDALIWETVVGMGRGALVYFASKDVNAFFAQDRRTLSAALSEEAAVNGVEVKAFGCNPSEKLLPALLAALRLDFPDPEYWPDLRGETSIHPVGGRLGVPSDLDLPVALPLPASAELAAPSVPTAAESDLAALMAKQRSAMESAEMRALGYVAFLEGGRKDTLFDLLERGGIAPELARNALERLVFMGLVKDTGNHFLPVAGPAADLATGLVTDELIALMAQTD